jgi:hypothetical protein
MSSRGSELRDKNTGSETSKREERKEEWERGRENGGREGS